MAHVAARAREQRLLVLGAGPEQLGLLEAARAHGIWTAVCDRDPAAPGFRARVAALPRLDRGRAADRAARRRRSTRRRDRARLGPRRRRGRAYAERLGLAAPGQARDRRGRQPQAPPARAARRARACRSRAGRSSTGEPGELARAVRRQGARARTAAAGRVLVLDDADLPDAIEEARALARSGAVLVEELVEGPEVDGQRVLGRRRADPARGHRPPRRRAGSRRPGVRGRARPRLAVAARGGGDRGHAPRGRRARDRGRAVATRACA